MGPPREATPGSPARTVKTQVVAFLPYSQQYQSLGHPCYQCAIFKGIETALIPSLHMHGSWQPQVNHL